MTKSTNSNQEAIKIFLQLFLLHLIIRKMQERFVSCPTVTVTDSQGTTYTDTTIVNVLNTGSLDASLRGKWVSMTNALSVKDTIKALTYIHSQSKPQYQEMFNALIDQLPSITTTQTEFNLISATDTEAKYELVTEENGEKYSYEVTFRKGENGQWMIDGF